MKQKSIIKRVISSPIVQAFLIYVSGGWIALEMTDYFINKYELNTRISDILSIILLIGLPVVITLTWYLNRTEEKEGAAEEEMGQSTSKDREAKHPGISYPLKRSQVIFSGFLIIVAILVTIMIRLHHQSKIKWARETALPAIEEIANDMTYEGKKSWIAFNLAGEASRYIPGDPVLTRMEERISWTVRFNSNPSGASVHIKPYDDVSADWIYLGDTPTDSITIPRGLSIIRFEKSGFHTVQDIIWNHWSFNENNLYYELPVANSIPPEMELITDTAVTFTLENWFSMPGLEHIPVEKTGNFLMDRYEVTNAQYKDFMDSGGYQNPDFWKYPVMKNGNLLNWEEAMELFTDRTGRPGPATWEIEDFPDGQDDYPVTGVSWYEAAAYAEFAGKDLPTIYHWSAAAYTYASGAIVPMSNINGDGPIQVGTSHSMNRLGIYDLAGNVREWCFNETERAGHRFILGGGWNDPFYSFNDANAQDPLDRSETNGFRCIKYIESEEGKGNLKKYIERPFRDFLNEPVVSDEIFETYLRQYQYDKTELNAVVENTIEGEDYIREKITFDAAYGDERMIAFLYLPKTGTPPFQTVIYFPGSGAIFQRTNDRISGRDMFFKSGRAFLYPVYKGTFERWDDLDSDIANETNFYREHVIMWVKDLMRSIDYLETRNDIDSEKLAYFGYSWGGFMGSIIPAVEPRIKISMLLVAGLEFQRSVPEVEPVQYLPHVTIPVLMLNGKYDFFFPYETSQLPFFELLGTPEDHKKLFLYEQGHNVPETQLAKETLAWLDKYFGPVNEQKH